MPRTPRPDSTPWPPNERHNLTPPRCPMGPRQQYASSGRAAKRHRTTGAQQQLQLQAHSRTTTTYPFHEDQSKNISDPVRGFRSVTALPRSPPGPKTIQEASMRPTPPPGIGYGACCSFKSMPVTKQNKTQHGLCGLSHSLLDP